MLKLERYYGDPYNPDAVIAHIFINGGKVEKFVATTNKNGRIDSIKVCSTLEEAQAHISNEHSKD